MNRIFYGMIMVAFFFAAFRELVWSLEPESLVAILEAWVPSVDWVLVTPAEGVEPPKAPMERMSAGLFGAAKASVNLAIGLVGAMAFFLGLMKVAEAGGMLKATARAIRPVMELLFPEVPADHPAMGAMIMNMSANALGLGNAATPFGIKAMQELDTLNPEKGTATNAMSLFLAINTSSVTILPTGVIALRDVMGSTAPAAVMGTTLFATLCSSSAGILAAKTFQRFSADPVGEVERRPITGAQIGVLIAYAAVFGLMVSATVLYGNLVSPWVVPLIVISLLSWGYFAGVPVYEVFVEGAKDGFSIATKIIPYLVAILGAVGMLRGAGAIDVFSDLVGGITSKFGMPPEALPMALLRPLSGSGAYGVMTDIMNTAGTCKDGLLPPDCVMGADTYEGLLVSTLQGSTETTFYVIAVYFGAVQITRIRHTMAAALTADFVGIVAAIIACQAYFALNG